MTKIYCSRLNYLLLICSALFVVLNIVSIHSSNNLDISDNSSGLSKQNDNQDNSKKVSKQSDTANAENSPETAEEVLRMNSYKQISKKPSLDENSLDENSSDADKESNAEKNSKIERNSKTKKESKKGKVSKAKNKKNHNSSSEESNSSENDSLIPENIQSEENLRQLQVDDDVTIPLFSNLTDAFLDKFKSMITQVSDMKDMKYDELSNTFDQTNYEEFVELFHNAFSPIADANEQGAMNMVQVFEVLTDELESFYGEYFPYNGQYNLPDKFNASLNAIEVVSNELNDAFSTYVYDFSNAFKEFMGNLTAEQSLWDAKQNLLAGKMEFMKQKWEYFNSTGDDTTTSEIISEPTRFSQEQAQSFLTHFTKVVEESLNFLYNATNSTLIKNNKFNRTNTTETTEQATEYNIPVTTLGYTPTASTLDLPARVSEILPNDSVLQKFNFTDKVKIFPKTQLRSAQSIPASQGLLTDNQIAGDNLSNLMLLFEQAKPQLSQYFQDFKNSEQGSQILRNFNSSNFTDGNNFWNNKQALLNEYGNFFSAVKTNFQEVLGNFLNISTGDSA